MADPTRVGLDTVGSNVVADLRDVPTDCRTCRDAVEHGRRYVASRAHDVDDARLLMQVLGLVDSPPPEHERTGIGNRLSRARATTNH